MERRRNSSEEQSRLLGPDSVAKPAKPAEKDDSYNGLVYAIMLFEGTGLLLPWNIILNA
jgi:hypothetical protein